MNSRHPFERPALTFTKQSGATPRYGVVWHDKPVPGAFITRVRGGWRVRIGAVIHDCTTLDEAKAMFGRLVEGLKGGGNG
jgi:hypothetical protein